MNGSNVVLRLAACMLVLSCGTRPVRAADSQPPNAYVIELALERGGKQVATPHLTVASGKPAQISLLQEGKRDRNLRVQLTASPAGNTTKGEPTVRVDLVVLEQLSGAWVVVGEPSMTVRDGTRGRLEVDGGVGAFGLSLKATSRFDPRAASAR